jgi:hypothetical protein
MDTEKDKDTDTDTYRHYIDSDTETGMNGHEHGHGNGKRTNPISNIRLDSAHFSPIGPIKVITLWQKLPDFPRCSRPNVACN